MKKIFLLSVLFIFVGNVSANTWTSSSGMIERIDGFTNKIGVYCIAGHVFVNVDAKTGFTQVMVNVHQSRTTSSNVSAKTRPMLCREYKKQMK